MIKMSIFKTRKMVRNRLEVFIMKKRILAIVLTAALILTSVPLMAFAGTDDPVYYGKGSNVYELCADPDTGEIPAGFGTAAYNGKIWTDKSVAVNGSGTGFEVKLKALAQEYVSTASSSRIQETLADVVFVLDFTTSMSSNSDVTISGSNKTETRIQALVDAFNVAANIICDANPHNRISVYGFGGSKSNAKATNFMPLANYTPASSGNFLEYVKSNKTNAVKTLSGVKKDGSNYSVQTVDLVNYTSSQYAIAASLNGFISDINSDTGSSARKPYVIFMTDGAATEASTSYDSQSLNTIKNAGLSTTDYTNGTSNIAAATILTACVWKDRVQDAYDAYNAKNGHEEKELDWFNIGLAIGDDNINARALVDPASLKTDTSKDAQNIKDSMSTYEKEKTISSTPNYYADGNYGYYTHDYCYFCDTSDLLNGAFTELAKLVEAESAAVNIPIVSNEVSGDVSSDMVFTDYIGEGMEATGFTLKIDDGTAVVGTDDDKDGTYHFEGYESTVSVTTSGNNQVVVWNLSASELAIFAFKDRKYLDNGQYTSADPSVLSYTVKLKDGETLEDYTDYSTVTNAVTSENAPRTTVEYTIPGDNSYYFDVTNVTGDEGEVVFDSSTLKNGITEGMLKNTNTTGTAAAAKAYSYSAKGAGTENSLCNVTGTLGNNGKIQLILKAEKTADKTETPTGKDVTYTTTVTNLTDDDHSFVIEDIFNETKTDTTTTTTQTGKVDGKDEADVTKTVTVTGEKDDVINGYDPIIKSVDGITVNYDEGEGTPSSDDDLDVKIIEPRFEITYVWVNAPSTGATLPIDNDTYPEGAEFPVDTDYPASYVVEIKNSYGNVTEKYTFSGWNIITIDDQSDAVLTGEHKMPASDITVHGIWTKTDIVPETYNITYVFDGTAGTDYPLDKDVAIDENDYEENQPFGVSTSAYDNVNDVDGFGNIKGVWSFDGWEKITIDNQDDAELSAGPDDEYYMPASDITIHGTWTYTAQTVATYNVSYVYDRFTPDGKTFPGADLPTDSNDYVNKQPYNVSGEDEIKDVLVEDTYGNQTGKWIFDGWYKATKGTGSTLVTDGRIPNDDVVIHGAWKYQETKLNKYHVSYIFDSVTPSGKSLPDDVTNQLPTDGDDYVNGQSFTAKTGITDVIVEDTYGNQIGKWIFDGWYKTTKGTGSTLVTNGKIPDDDVVIHGAWKYQETELNKYHVSYVFDLVTPSDKSLPDDVTKKLPTDGDDYVNGQNFTAKTGITDVIVEDTYGNQIGTWKFDGWYKTTKGTGSTLVTNGKIPNDDVVIHGKWSYEEKALTEYKVSYVFDGKYPSTAALPTPNPETGYVNKQPFEATMTYVDINDVDDYGNVKGVWHFDGWYKVTKDSDSTGASYTGGVIPADDVTIHGKWSYTEKTIDQYKVTWVFDGEAPDETLPSTVSGLVKGQNVPADSSLKAGSKHTDVTSYGNPTVIWTFDGWTKTTKDTDGSEYNGSKMPASDLTIHGTWTKETQTVNHYNITYVFDGEAPKGATPPIDEREYENTQPYQFADNPKAITETDTYGNTTDIWTFNSWYKTTKDTADGVEYTGEKNIPDSNLVIHGTWDHEKVTPENFNVSYVFDSVTPSGKSLPEDVTNQLPSDGDDYVNGQSFSAETGITDVIVEDTYGNQIGTWKFDGWYKTTKGTGTELVTNGKIPNDDVVIHGAWKYQETELNKYHVSYVFDSVTPSGKSLPEDATKQLPTDGNDYVNGQGFEAKTGIADVKVFDEYDNQIGTWKFDGWYKTTKGTGTELVTNGKIPNDDVVIHGKWKYDEIVLDKYNVSYVFDSVTPSGKSLPEDVTNQLPSDGNDYVNGQGFDAKTGIADVKVFDEYGNRIGTWVFDGWYETTKGTGTELVTDGKIPNDDVVIHGAWKYDEITLNKYNVSYVFDSVTPSGKSLPEDAAKQLPTDSDEYVNGQGFTAKTGIDPVPVNDEFGNQIGTWLFDGWYKTTKGTGTELVTNGKIPNDDVVIHGAWKYAEEVLNTYNVSYVFDSVVPAGKALPAEANNQLPTDSKNYVNNEGFTAKTGMTDIPVYDTYGNQVGTWKFDGWYKTTKGTGSTLVTNGKIPNDDVVIHGQWKLVEQAAPTHTVTVPEDPQDPESDVIEKEIVNGAYIIVDPNSGIWEHDGNSYNSSTNVTIVDDLDIENPERDNYTFTGWTITTTDDGVTKYTANWEINDRNVEFTPDPDDDDPTGELVITKGTPITIDPNGGIWTYDGETHTGKTVITIDDDTRISDPTKDGYEFVGWDKTVDEDGNITLTAKWKLKIDIPDFIIPAVVIGGITAGGITGAAITGSLIGIPVVIAGGAAAYEAIKDVAEEEEHENPDIPYTGSDMTVTVIAAILALISMATAAYIIIDNKKRKKSAE